MAKSYILSDNAKFFHRSINGEFETKWMGLWDKTKKYLEYFAFKVNDEWLSKQNQTGFSYGVNSATHYYETKNFFIKERLKLIDNLLKVSLKIINKSDSSKNFNILLEFATNFRNFDEGVVDVEYRTEYLDNCLKIEGRDRKLVFRSSREGIFSGEERYKIHYPSNQQFKCFIPRNYVVYGFVEDSTNLDFYFFIEKDTITKKSSLKSLLEDNFIDTNFDFVSELYKIAILNLNSCFDGKTFVAGYPWFAYYWARDAAFSIIGASLTSMQSYARDSLLFFFKYFEDKFPNYILDNKVVYNSKDSLPLFIISLYEYFKNSGDFEILRILKSKILRAFEFYKNNSSDNGFIYSESNETWMDTINRDGYNIEIQTFWFYALKCLSKIFDLLNLKEQSNIAKLYSERLKSNILKHFLKDGVFIDNLKAKKVTINSIFPFVFNVCSEREIFKNIETHLKENYGFLSLSKFDPEFNEIEYHKGASWYHLNALVSYVYFKMGDFESGLKMLKTLYSLKDILSKNCLIEVYNARNKDFIVKKPIGLEESSYLQAWSAACIIFAIQKGLFGIDVNSHLSSITLMPLVNFTLKRKIGSDLVKLTFLNREFRYESKNKKRYRVLLKYL